MRASRRRHRALIAVIVLLASAAATRAHAADDAVRFAADAEKARAHLLVSEQLYMTGQARPAALHAAHPVHELGNRLIGPLRRVDAARADRLRDALKEPGRAIEAKVPPTRYVATVASVATALDDAVTRVAGADARASVPFRTKVISMVLAGIADEYEEAYKNDRITQPIEYQDAYAFFRRTQTLYDALPPESRRADVDMTALSKAFPSHTPPPSPMPLKTVKSLTDRIATTLTK